MSRLEILLDPPRLYHSVGYRLLPFRQFIPFLRERHLIEKMVGPLGCWDKLQRFQFDFLRSRGLQSRHTLLDIGCGPLQGGIAFIRYLDPGRYTGIDIRPASVAMAFRLLTRSGLVEKNPRLVVSKTFGRDELGDCSFDYLWASQILYHLEPEALRRCLEQVSARMNPDSRFYGNILHDPDICSRWGSWEGFPFFYHSHDFLRDTARDCGLAFEMLGQMRDFGYPMDSGLGRFSMLEFRKRKHDPGENRHSAL